MLVTLVALVTLLLASSEAVSRGSCSAARKCCHGKDPHCLVQNVSQLLREIEDEDDEGILADEPCYCDHGCLELGDCCPDFKDYCGVLDCQVGDWESWSACDVSCGVGTSTRVRQVIRPEANGGKPCPALEEKKTCTASKCSKRHLDKVSAIKESAMLLPGKYARQLRRGRQYDVRSNLKTYRHKESRQYCIVFQVDKAMRSCLKNRDTSELHRGNTVCVVCDDKAQRDNLGGRCTGHGAEGKRTRFKNLLNPRCHGRWTRLELTNGECPCSNGPDFTFV